MPITPPGFSGEPPPPLFNMAAYCIGRAAKAAPAKTALVVVAAPEDAPVETWSFAEIEAGVLKLARGLAELGLAPGDRLLIRLDNTSSYALLFFGAIAAGLVPIPTSSQLTEPEVRFMLADSGAAAIAISPDLALPNLPAGVRVITSSDVAEMLSSALRGTYRATAADDPAYLIYTSGTTARPKGVLHAQRAAWGRRPMYQGWYGITAEDRVLHAGAFNWTYTLGVGLTDPWANGATSIISPSRKTPEVWPRLIVRHDATIFAAVPGLYRQILKAVEAGPVPLGRLRHGLIAGETPPPGLVETWKARTGRDLYEAIGMSEISTFISSSPSVPRKDGRIGRPQPGRSVCILPTDSGTSPLAPETEGLLAVHRSDPAMMLGYWQRPDEEREAYRGDWFISGDLAIMDADGYIAHRGRANDVIKALGYRVSPAEVEAVLLAHPEVLEAACIGHAVSDELTIVAAVIVPRDPQAPPAIAELKAFAADRLAAYKCPREIGLARELPRTANGKLVRKAVRLTV
jgi:acyl-coenzyme A synthetase/AMP-(fatty) acid ligase